MIKVPRYKKERYKEHSDQLFSVTTCNWVAHPLKWRQLAWLRGCSCVRAHERVAHWESNPQQAEPEGGVKEKH